MSKPETTAVILAAGKGTRMRSNRPKVLHPVANAPMLAHVLGVAGAAGIGRAAVVVGPDMEQVAEAGKTMSDGLQVFIQQDQRGTADAVLAAKDALQSAAGPVLVLYGDTPLLETDTLSEVQAALTEGADLVVVGFDAPDPTGYGRLLVDDAGTLTGIREEKDASEAEKGITLCNSGIVGFGSGALLLSLLDRIGNDNAKGEYYLTDAVGLAAADGLKLKIVTADHETLLGVNSRAELATAEAVMQKRLRARALAGGVTMTAPETVFLSADTKIAPDVIIEPNVIIGPGVTIGEGAHIKGFCHFEQATIGRGATVGPFARLRPGAELSERAHVGNFVEIKKSTVGVGAKVNHLTYIGDAEIGAEANIGAGTITCNYDGFDKHRTEIGEGAFIGSNSSLVAPVKIGDGAYVGSGSVIVHDVSPGALSLSRSAQEEKADWATRYKARRMKAKQGE
ncbi:Bifunctional protein GlmU [Methyloligella halotolerans]|uniref:Bifunctional protein GlmU n=1 Tax=Methyloligella halotolerans TaxID=1177755 RepID=A0A1E2S2B1_9HYPH|nr:bifunctional UDP-N-acetylglucosamine diphosphorylase/glucosamine-1-phosphate N-acetyltransferase GlmU [Methyloligella halotolerans]ODA68643.1 Bifunctional protein GlmU [Methyloligella halotolerans]